MKIEKIFTLTANKLKKALAVELLEHGYSKSEIHNKTKFLYAEGSAPYMLVAHLDTVHKQTPSIICYSKDGNYMMSPQGIGGDDRCGVYIILSLLSRLNFKPHVVFTMEEETGGIGASEFADYITTKMTTPDLKYIVEFDRKGNKDCVFYHCDNQDFVKFVEKFGFKKAYGTFSDISVIAPALGVAAVNLSSGYYNPHTEHEYVSMKDMSDIITMSEKMLCFDCESFEYIEEEYYYKYSNYYKNRKISVSFVPENTLYVCSKYTDYIRTNSYMEIAVDELGNYYRYNKSYNDLTSIYDDVIPIDDLDEPMYDADNAQMIALYY